MIHPKITITIETILQPIGNGGPGIDVGIVGVTYQFDHEGDRYAERCETRQPLVPRDDRAATVSLANDDVVRKAVETMYVQALRMWRALHDPNHPRLFNDPLACTKEH